VLGTVGQGEGPYGGGSSSGKSCIGLVTDEGRWTRDYEMSGRGSVAQRWISTRALDTLRRHLLGVSLIPIQ
jgi:hypothetical protein